MSRLLVATALALFVAAPAPADTPDPFDLVQGLGENGMTDLALEYLNELEKDPKVSKVAIPLARAKTNLLLAQQETDEAVREAAVAVAKKQFDDFLTANPKDPRAAEASLALARVLSLQAKTALNRAARIDVTTDGRTNDAKLKEKMAAFAAVRPVFRESRRRLADAAKQITAAVQNLSPDDFRRRTLTRDVLQAELDGGINQFNMADTYILLDVSATPEKIKALKGVAGGFATFEDDLTLKTRAVEDARKIFEALAKRDANEPICWAARAWVGACYYEVQDMAKAADAFKTLRADAALKPGPGADGVRMVEFFEAQRDYVSGRTGDQAVVRAARQKTKAWLDKDKYKARMTPERLSMTFYHAVLTQHEAEIDPANVYEKKDPKDKSPRKLLRVSGAALATLQEAVREYKKLLETDNDYTERATRQRMRAVRFIVGDATKPPAQYTNFDECFMAAQVRLAALDEAADDAAAADDKKPAPAKPERTPEQKREKAMAEVVALFERARDLITPATPAKDADEARLWLAVAYRRCGHPQAAAVAAEHVARTARGSVAAKAGLWAIDCYHEAREKVDAADGDAKAVDRSRALAVGLAVDQAARTDPATDGVRTRVGQIYLEEKQYKDAFDVLSKVGPGYAGAAAARTLLGRAAFMIYVAKDSPLAADEKAGILHRAREAVEAVGEPANPDNLRAYFTMRNVLAQLYLLEGGPHLAKAEAIAAQTAARAAAAPLPDGDRKAARFAAEEVRLRALYAQAVPLYKEMKYKELAEKMERTLAGLKAAGPAAAEVEAYRGKEADPAAGDTGSAVVAADSLDKYRRDVIGLALQGRIREGAFDAAADHFKLLEQLGGSVEATTDALARLVTQVRPQIDDLKKQMKGDEAQKLTDAVGKMLTDQAAKDKLGARPRAFLGRALRDLGMYDKALEVVEKVPAVDAETLKQPLGGLDQEKRDAVIAYQVAQIEKARAYRLGKQYDKADEILTAALGPDGKSGWAKSLEFRKERVYVIEDRAADAAAGAPKLELWKKATAAWTEVIRPYIAFVTAPIKAGEDAVRVRQDREKMYPVILDLFVEEKRCFAKANSQLLAANPAKVADSLNNLGKQIARLEKGYAKGLTTDVRERYAVLLEEYAPMKEGYQQGGGTAFLNPTADLTDPAAPPAGEKK